MNKRIRVGLLLAILVCSTCGCWSKYEINDRTFISGLFVDFGEDDSSVELTILNILPNRMSMNSGGAGSSSSTPYGVVTKTGRTLAEAFLSIQKDLTRRISWGQTRVVVIGRDYAEKGIKDLLEFIARQPTFPLKAYMYVAPAKAKELTKLTPVYEQSPSEVLSEFSNLKTSVRTNVKQFLQGDNSRLGNSVPLLNMNAMPMVSEKEKLSPWAGKNGAALFQTERMVGTASNDEAMLLSWAEQTQSYINYSIPMDDGYLSVLAEKLKSRIKPRRAGDRIIYEIRLTGDARVLSSETSEDITKPATIHKAETTLNEKLEKDMEKLLKHSQQLKADILQLGSLVEYRYPRYWEQIRHDWSTVYKDQVDFDVDVLIDIQHLNAEGKSYWMID